MGIIDKIIYRFGYQKIPSKKPPETMTFQIDVLSDEAEAKIQRITEAVNILEDKTDKVSEKLHTLLDNDYHVLDDRR